MSSIIINVNDEAKEKKIIDFLNNLNVSFKSEKSSTRKSKKELVEELRNPELDGTVTFLENPVLPTGENWEKMI